MYFMSCEKNNFREIWQKIIAVVVCVSMLWGPNMIKVKAEGDTFIEKGVKYKNSDSGLVVEGCDAKNLPNDVVLKDGVTSIDDFAFEDCKNLTSITIKEGAKFIGNGAFKNCEKLKSITIENGITSIGVSAFYCCKMLKSITLPKSVAEIGVSAFEGCSGLESVMIKNSDASMAADVFEGCESLTKIIVPQENHRKLLGNTGVLLGDENTFTNSGMEQGRIVFCEDIQSKLEKVQPSEGNPINQYVDEDGKTSVKITGKGVFWLREESTDVYTKETTHAWYGIDNSDGIFEEGSRFYVQWISAKENPGKCSELIEKFDMKSLLKNGWEASGYIFKVGVIDTNGDKYEQLSKSVKLYVQLGTDWNLKSLKAYWISSGQDQKINVSKKSLKSPEDNDYGVMTLHHFSPYILFDDPLEEETDDYENTSYSEVSSLSQKKTGDVDSIVLLGILGLLTILSVLYLITKKERQSRRF